MQDAVGSFKVSQIWTLWISKYKVCLTTLETQPAMYLSSSWVGSKMGNENLQDIVSWRSAHWVLLFISCALNEKSERLGIVTTILSRENKAMQLILCILRLSHRHLVSVPVLPVRVIYSHICIVSPESHSQSYHSNKYFLHFLCVYIMLSDTAQFWFIRLACIV